MEAYETFIVRKPGKPIKRGFAHKRKVLSLVDRDTKRVRSMVVDDLKPATLAPILSENIAKEARLMTDEAGHYRNLGKAFASHASVSHNAGEYVHGDVTTNTVEGYFSVFKKGMRGVYQHCVKHHLHRYQAEFNFRYNEHEANGVDDHKRTDSALSGIVGKRLRCQTSGC